MATSQVKENLKLSNLFTMVIILLCFIFTFPGASSWQTFCGRGLTEESVREWTTKMADTDYLENILYRNIGVPRVSGSQGIRQVASFIKSQMQSLGWTVEEDTFSAAIPNGTLVPFNNIIATQNPLASKRIVLACHYDSKYYPDNPSFIGATDSVVPCSIMIDTAKKLKEHAPNYLSGQDTTLQLIFFDGEEAFVQWSETDSLYGSRHLANRWRNNLANIDIFILLDLIGGQNLQFRNKYFTYRNYRALEVIQNCMMTYGLVDRRHYMFYSGWRPVNVEDDHKPFVRLRWNLPVLHLCSWPFPRQWHKASDTLDNLDRDSIRDFMRVLNLYLLSEDVSLIGPS